MVYRFDQESVDNVEINTGANGETQGPEETVSSVVTDDEGRLLKSLSEIKVLLDRFRPSLSAKFDTESILTLVVEDAFSDRRAVPVACRCNSSLTTGSVGQSTEARLKRECSTPYSYFTSSSS